MSVLDTLNQRLADDAEVRLQLAQARTLSDITSIVSRATGATLSESDVRSLFESRSAELTADCAAPAMPDVESGTRTLAAPAMPDVESGTRTLAAPAMPDVESGTRTLAAPAMPDVESGTRTLAAVR